MLENLSQPKLQFIAVPAAPPQTFTDAGGITSWFTLRERRAGVRVVHQRGLGPGTALAHRITGAGRPEALGRDLVSPRGEVGKPRGREKRERERNREKRRKKSESERRGWVSQL